MGLELNTIITLDNSQKYMVLNETLYNGKKYFLTKSVDDNNMVISNDSVILEQMLEGLDIFVTVVSDSSLIEELEKQFI